MSVHSDCICSRQCTRGGTNLAFVQVLGVRKATLNGCSCSTAYASLLHTDTAYKCSACDVALHSVALE
jgi:hypothetical protein